MHIYSIKSLNLYSLLLVAVFFDAYALFYVYSYPVTIFTVVSVLYLIHNLVDKYYNGIKKTPQFVLLVILITYLLFNYTYFGFRNTKSFMQILYFLILSVLAYRDERKESFDAYLFLFQKIMICLSLYGIYQFFGRMLGLPFTDLIIKDHMVTGYNWTNAIQVCGLIVYRSNAIFREPSYFAQILAVSILIDISDFLFNEHKKFYAIYTALKIVAMILTFSGTGILMLIIGYAIYAFTLIKKRIFLRRSIPIVIASIFVGVYVLLFTKFGSYFLNRAKELFVYNSGAASGYVRFRAWIMVVSEAWNANLLLGSGVGTGTMYVAKYSEKFYAMTLNGFARIATELGLLGISIFCAYIISFFGKKKNVINSKEYLVIACSIIPLMFMHEALSSNIFWMFVILISCNLKRVNKGVPVCLKQK